MSEQAQFLQEQINNLQISLAAQEVLTKEAISKMGKNQDLLEALHSRLDKMNDRFDSMESEIRDIDIKVLTKEERKEELEEIVQAKVGSWILKVVGGALTAGAVALFAWFQKLV